jgi:hypothetical protein
VWADVVSGPSRERIWRFDGPSGKARPLARADGLHAATVAVEPGGGALWAASDVPRGGKFFHCSGEEVVRIDGRTGRRSAVASLRLPKAPCGAVTGATFARGAFYFATRDRLYRVRP